MILSLLSLFISSFTTAILLLQQLSIFLELLVDKELIAYMKNIPLPMKELPYQKIDPRVGRSQQLLSTIAY
jgi:hypothetical protein